MAKIERSLARCADRLTEHGQTIPAAHIQHGADLLRKVLEQSERTETLDPGSCYEGGKQASELPPTLYRLDPGSGVLTIAADDFEGPNGLAFSPDETLLNVAETGDQFAAGPRRCIRRFAVTADGALSGGEVFHTVAPGYADGFRLDEGGNLWSGAGDGVHCIAPDGTLLGKILVPFLVASLCFGGRERSRLFLCASHTLMAIHVNVRGAVRP